MLHLVRRRMATVWIRHANAYYAFLSSIDENIKALCKENRLNEAMQMLHNTYNLHSSTYVYLLQCCIQKKALEQGKRIHAHIVNQNERRLGEDIFLQNSILAMYAKCGKVADARSFFDGMVKQDVFSWNVMIAAYKKQGFFKEALGLFYEMQINGVQPNEFTFPTVILLCSSYASMAEGVDIHRQIIRRGFQSDSVVVNALIDMYAKFENMHKARVLFDKMQDRNMISWNAMITGYGQNGLLEEAVNLFQNMPERDTISWSAMITGYAQNGLLHEAEKLFEKMHQRDTISWTAMIAGYSQNGCLEKALKLFQNMELIGFRPDSITFASIIPVCATVAALEVGMTIHAKVVKSEFHSVIVANALIDMYAKCGSIQKARVLFDKMHCRDTTSWSTMIAGYSMHGSGKEAIELFEQMKRLGVSPNHITLLNLLSACSHTGLVEEGYQYFNSMKEYYHITPTIEHYVCIIDLLGRAGRLDEAKNFIDNMPIKPNAVMWTCLLGACRIHNNQELAEFVQEQLLKLNPKYDVPYVLLSNIYAMSGRWKETENVREMMKDRGIQKLPGCSWIQVNQQVHNFAMGDRSHPKLQETI